MAPANNSSPVPIETTTYSIAMDRKGNVSYKLIKTLAGRTSGALFEKTAKDSLGVYTRLGREDAPFACKIEEAHPKMCIRDSSRNIPFHNVQIRTTDGGL